MLAASSRTLANAALRASQRRAYSAIAGKYSNAAYNAALSKSPATLTKVQTELTNVASTIKSEPALAAFIDNPLLSATERSTGLEAVYKAATKGSKDPVSDVTKNLFTVLSENGRLGETIGVIEGFDELVAKYKGELEITVTSAAPLPRDALAKLEGSLKQSEAAKKSKVVKVTNKVSRLLCRLSSSSDDAWKVNPSVLGGIIVDVGDKTIDLSVASRVTKLNSLLQRTRISSASKSSHLLINVLPESV